MANSWINYLNELPGSEGPSPPNGIAGQPILPDGGIDGAVLSDELRAQLAQWTTVSFGFDHSNSVSSDSPDNLNSSLFDFSKDNGLDDLLNPSSAKPDPSPYAKRPFGQFGLSGHSSAQQYGLERSFNAFAPTVSHNPAGISTSPAFDHSPFSFGLGNSGLLSNSAILTAPDGSHTLFASPAQSNIAVPSIAGTPNHVAPEVTAEAPATKKQRRTSSLETSLSKPTLARSSGSSASTPIAAPLPTPASLISVESPSTPSAETTPAGKALRLPGKQPLLTKAAILAAQAAELKAQASAALTAEEEAARTAELERIAVEDDKRRRNTAASGMSSLLSIPFHQMPY